LSPILVRPVREQLEHDRVIRLLQAKYKRKFEVAVNPGHAQVAPVGAGPNPWYPDLVLQAAEKSRKLQGVVEVETAESVNHLEAMSQWATFAKLRVPFHLYVPAASVDSARRLCADLQIPADELWAYHSVGDQLRFALVQRSEAGEAAARAAAAAAAANNAAKAASANAKAPVKKAVVSVRRPTAKAAKPALPGKPATPAKVTKPAKAAAKPAAKPLAAARAKNGNGKTSSGKAASRTPARSAKATKRK
jgi:hypothetical protein